MVLHPADAASERLSELAPGRTHDTPAFQHRWWAIEHRRLPQRLVGHEDVGGNARRAPETNCHPKQDSPGWQPRPAASGPLFCRAHLQVAVHL
jgi:hypothetical protein